MSVAEFENQQFGDCWKRPETLSATPVGCPLFKERFAFPLPMDRSRGPPNATTQPHAAAKEQNKTTRPEDARSLFSAAFACGGETRVFRGD